MKRRSNKVFWTSFALTLSLGLVFLFVALPQAQAIDVNVTAEVAGSSGPVCGNGTVQGSEECDDGNTQSGDGCNSGCEIESEVVVCTVSSCFSVVWSGICVPSVGNPTTGIEGGTGITNCNTACSQQRGCTPGAAICGNGTIETGEQCDDSSQCCVSCQTALQIQFLNVIVSNQTSATVTWTVSSWQSGACGGASSATSVLEWGQGGTYNEGSAILNGSGNSHTINGLLPNISNYAVRVVATQGTQTDTEIRGFNTLVAEICNNNVDDDGDGLIDIADNSCPCTAQWTCNPLTLDEAECVNSQQNIVCTQVDLGPQLCWDTSNRPVETQGCGPCDGVICQPGEVIIDQNTCQCGIEPGICGNGVCEPLFNEDPTSCIQDCPADCISNWDCDPWQPPVCPVSGIQSQICRDNNNCQIPINPPPTTRTCGDVCPGLICGIGQQINTQLCSCDNIIPFCGNAICESGENYVICSQDCVEECTPAWAPTSWGPCINGVQQRSVTDLNNCNLNLDRPPEVRSCDGACEPEIACKFGQTIDTVNCRCNNIVPFCGNSVCENSEKTWSCPVDCGLPPEFRLTLTACLDGLDNDKDGLVDYPVDTGCTGPADNSELNLEEILENIQKFIGNVLDNEVVEQANIFAAPAIVLAVAVNTFASFSLLNFLSYARYFFSQPFAVISRRKRKRWGVVYNSLTKQPVDLAIVRLYDRQTNRIVQSRVTDRLGRYSFLAQPGKYYLTITKPKFDFPSEVLKGEREDAKYLDLYHGQTIEVTDKNASITANIPIDSRVPEKPARKVIIQHYLRKVQYIAAFSGIPLAVISLAISPSWFTASLLGFHVLLYFLFRRLGYQKPPKSWGIIYDKDNKKPLGRAITRIYDKKYNKLLETRVTDARGRYSFLVNNNKYVVTAEKLGYSQAKVDEVDLLKKDVDTVINMDIGLNKANVTQAVIAPTLSGTPVNRVGMPAATPSVVISEPKSLSPDDVKESLQKVQSAVKPSITEYSIEEKIDDLSVSRGSLEELIQRKQQLVEVHQEIDQKQAELEKLENKVEAIEEEVESRLASEQAGKQGSEGQVEKSENNKMTEISDPSTALGAGQKADEKPESKDLPPTKPDKSIFS